MVVHKFWVGSTPSDLSTFANGTHAHHCKVLPIGLQRGIEAARTAAQVHPWNLTG